MIRVTQCDNCLDRDIRPAFRTNGSPRTLVPDLGMYVIGVQSFPFRRVPVSVPDGCLLVQAGKQLERLSGGHVLAGFHEVRRATLQRIVLRSFDCLLHTTDCSALTDDALLGSNP